MDKINFLQDKPINTPDNDKFGHKHYANLLFDLITEDNYQAPYNIGLLGKWGVGKSSIKEMCIKRILDEKIEKIFCIDFNAWKYGGDGIKRALLKEIYLKLGGTDDEIRDSFSRHITKQILELNSNSEMWKNFRNIAFNYAQIFLVLVVLWFLSENLSLLTSIGQVTAVVSFTTLAGYIIKGVLQKNNSLVPLFQNITKMDLPQTTAEVYEEFLIKQTEIFKKGEVKDKEIGAKVSKIVVFVDDIDRLPSAQEMIEAMNAIRAFMDIKKLPKEIGFVFVISCCEYKISEALCSIEINNKNKDDNDSTYETDQQVEAKRFLDKIFNFRIDIPPFPYRDMIDYSKKVLENQINDFNEFEKIISESGTDIDNLLCRLIHPKVQEPRQALQILNTFFQGWNIALQRESISSQDSAGGLAKDIITKHPLTLAVLSVLKVDFPYFYKELLVEPKLLSYVLETVRTGKEPDFYIDEKIKQIFVTNDDKSGKKLKSDYYDLELYLNLINNKFELPKSLKPFLLLNQDPTSRRLGEGAFELEEALINKRSHVIIRLLNLTKDVLTVQDAKLLQSIYENCQYPLHKENAFYTLVQLTKYITNETKFLIDTFADTAHRNQIYRDMLTIEDYEKLLFAISPNKANKVVESIEKSYMKQYNYSPEEDATEQNLLQENFSKAALLKLKYYSLNEDKIDIAFIEWVTEPKIGEFYEDETDEGNAVFLSFKFTLSCITEYPFLIKHISRHFLQAVIKFYKSLDNNELPEDIKEKDLLESIDKALLYLLENDKNSLEGIIGEFIESENKTCFNLIFKFVKSKNEEYKDSTIDFVLGYLLWFSSNELKTPDIFNDLNEVFEFIKPLIEQKYNVLSKDTLQYLKECILLTTSKEIYQDFTFWGHQILSQNRYANIEEIESEINLESFREPINTQLRVDYRKYLLEKYCSLNPTIREELTKKLVPTIMKQNVSILTEEELDILAILVEKLQEDPILNANEINKFIEESIKFVEAYLISANNIAYFQQIFPEAKTLFKFFENCSLAQHLHNICTNVNFYPTCIKGMENVWKDLNVNIWEGNNYAQEIFDSVLKSSTSIDEIASILNFYKEIKIIATEDNQKAIRGQLYKYKESIEQFANLIVELDPANYTIDAFLSFGVGIEESEISKNSLYKVWAHVISNYKDTQLKEITEKLLFQHEEWRFKVWCQLLKENTGGYKELNQVIEDYCTPDKITMLLPKRMLITDLLFGDERKDPSRILLLNSNVIFESELDNKNEITINMLKWSYDLYNDIIKHTPMLNLSEEQKKNIQEIFDGRTFGRIRFKR